MAGESSDRSVVAQLSFELGIDTDSLYKELTQFTNKADRQLTSSFANTGKNIGKKLLAGLGFGAAIYKLKDFVSSSIELGSNLTEVQNVVDTSFKTMSSAVNAFAKDAMYNFGLSETVAKKYMGTIGAMNNAFGFTEKASYDMAEAVTGLAGDVASFYNLESDEAFTKLKSIWTGETETLKDLGVVMTQTALDQYALNNGFGKTTAKMTEQEKVMLRFQYVTTALSDATGDFVKTQDTWANQTRVLSLRIESLKATMGQGFINLFTPILRGLNSILEKLSAVAEGFKLFTESITGTTAVTQGFANVATGAATAAGNVDNITTSLQEAKKELAGFDKISKIGDESSNISSGISTPADTNIGDMGQASGEVSSMANSIADALEPLRKLIEDWKIGDFFSVGGDVSDLVIQINDFIAEAIASVNWENLGENVGAFLRGIKWLDVLKSLWGVLDSAITGALDFYCGMFKEAPFETALITAMAVWKLTGVGDSLVGKINTALGTSLPKGGFSIKSALKVMFELLLAFKIGDKIGSDIAKMLDDEVANILGDRTFFDYVFEFGFEEGLQDLANAMEPSALLNFIKANGGTTEIEFNITAETKGLAENINSEVENINLKKIQMEIGFDNIDKAAEKIQLVADAYYALSQNSSLSDEDLQKLNGYKEALENFGINVEGYINPETNAWIGTREALDELISSQKKHLKTLAYQDAIVEGEKALISLKSEIANVEKEIGKNATYQSIIDQIRNMEDAGYSLNEVLKTIDAGKNSLEYKDFFGNVNQSDAKAAAKLYQSLRKVTTEYKNQEKYVSGLYAEVDILNGNINESNELVSSGITQAEGLDHVVQDIGNSSQKTTQLVANSVTNMNNSLGGLNKNQSLTMNTSQAEKSTTWGVANMNNSLGRLNKNQSLTTNTSQAEKSTTWGVANMNTSIGKLNKKQNLTMNTTSAINTVQSTVSIVNKSLEGIKTLAINLDTSNALTKAEKLRNGIEASLKGMRITLQVAIQEKIKDTIASAINIGKAAKQGIGTITAFATGGFPEDGLFFANHNELVGKFSNGNTAVANNEQILTGIENATARGILGGLAAVNLRNSMVGPPPLAMTEKYSAGENEIKQMIQEVVAQSNAGSGYTKEMVIVLKELLQLIRELDLDIVIDGKKLKDIIVDRINEHTQQTGVCEIQI